MPAPLLDSSARFERVGFHLLAILTQHQRPSLGQDVCCLSFDGAALARAFPSSARFLEKALAAPLGDGRLDLFQKALLPAAAPLLAELVKALAPSVSEQWIFRRSIGAGYPAGDGAFFGSAGCLMALAAPCSREELQARALAGFESFASARLDMSSLSCLSMSAFKTGERECARGFAAVQALRERRALEAPQGARAPDPRAPHRPYAL